MGLVEASPTGIQSRCFGGPLKVGVLNVGSKLFPSEGEMRTVSSFLILLCLCARGLGLLQEYVSTSSCFVSCFFSFTESVGVIHLVSGFPSVGSFKGITKLAINSPCPWEEVSSGTSYIATLNQNSQRATYILTVTSTFLYRSL